MAILGTDESGSLRAVFIKNVLIVAYKYVTHSKYINKTETKQKQRPATHVTGQVL